MKAWEEFNLYSGFFARTNSVHRKVSKHQAYLPKPITNEYLKLVEENKIFLMKKDLVKGEFYFGQCRNAQVAVWNGDKFIYIRSKFGSEFPEEINHFEDDNGFDLFLPYFLLKEKDKEIPYIKECIEKLSEI